MDHNSKPCVIYYVPGCRKRTVKGSRAVEHRESRTKVKARAELEAFKAREAAREARAACCSKPSTQTLDKHLAEENTLSDQHVANEKSDKEFTNASCSSHNARSIVDAIKLTIGEIREIDYPWTPPSNEQEKEGAKSRKCNSRRWLVNF